MKNLKIFASTIMAGITFGNSAIAASAAQMSTDEHKGGKSEQSVIEVYDDKKDYDMKKPIEIMIPTGLKVYKNGNQEYEYSTVMLEFNKNSINPTELTQIINAASYLNNTTKADEFVYNDANVASYEKFVINASTKKLSKNQLLKYIEKKNQNIDKKREKIDHNTYAEFMLPVLGNYYYTNSKNKTAIYRRIDYIYFYVPYNQLSCDFDFAKISEKVYEHYQNTLDHVITYNEIKNVKVKTK